MEKALKSFSIESPAIVQLLMSDGSQHRVAPADLPKYLAGADLDRVKKAFTLRSRYFKSLPKWTAVFGFTAVIAFMVVSAGSGQYAHQKPTGGEQATRITSVPMAATSTDIQTTGSMTVVTSNPQAADGFVATSAASVTKASVSAKTRTSLESGVPARPTSSPLDPQSTEHAIYTPNQIINVVTPVVNQILSPAQRLLHGGLLGN